MAAAPAAQPDPEPEPEVLYLWPCNVQAWSCWLAVQTQWRSGMDGPTGLDYGSVHTYLHAVRNLRGQALRDVFAGIQAAERATLEVWAERRARHDQKQGTSGITS
jgi:hypothetical protein